MAPQKERLQGDKSKEITKSREKRKHADCVLFLYARIENAD